MYFLLKMGIFHCYVSLPEGSFFFLRRHLFLNIMAPTFFVSLCFPLQKKNRTFSVSEELCPPPVPFPYQPRTLNNLSFKWMVFSKKQQFFRCHHPLDRRIAIFKWMVVSSSEGTTTWNAKANQL